MADQGAVPDPGAGDAANAGGAQPAAVPATPVEVNPNTGNTSSFTQSEIDSENGKLLEHLNKTLSEGRAAVTRVRKKLNYTYWVLVGMSVIMFFVGMFLLLDAALHIINDGTIPGLAEGATATADQTTSNLYNTSLTSGGLGLMDIILLFVSQPFKRIRQLMADMSQLTLLINSYQSQIGLIMLGVDMKKREVSIPLALTQINNSVTTTVKAIESYTETTNTSSSS